jgi:uncharacterized protein (DUF2062 family)
MDWSRVVGSPTEVRGRLRAAFSADHPPHLIGVSFALGLFLLSVPNLGASLLVIAAIGYRFEWAHPLALSAAAVILNPLVKGVVYAASFALGTALLGPVPGMFSGRLSLSTGPQVLVRLLVGNLVLSACLAAAGYVLARYGVRAVRRYRDDVGRR